MKGNDKDTIEAAMRELTQLSQKLGERVYAQENAGAQAGGGGQSQQRGGGKGGEGDVVDAEFEEVKDGKKS
jgi:molecular chaperone DnaK